MRILIVEDEEIERVSLHDDAVQHFEQSLIEEALHKSEGNCPK